MDIDRIKTLTDLMVEKDLTELIIREGDDRILLRRGSPHAAASYPPPSSAFPVVHQNPAPAALPAPPQDDLTPITSPMVGTFYASPDPESPHFVGVGDRITPESVVCIIEAMKVFNEIKAEVAGVIAAIEVQNGKPVEFGQALFKVRKE